MISPKDRATIRQIAERASSIFLRLHDTEVPWQYIASELELVHDEVVALRLDDMLAWEHNFDVMHDIVGIHRHLEIGKTCRLTGCFLPRFARMESTNV